MTGLCSKLLKKLIAFDVPPDVADRVLAGYADGVILAKTNNPRVLGHLVSALGEFRDLLDLPELRLCDGRTLFVPRIECHLNTTPRGLTGKVETVWPLKKFWQCLRNFAPGLPNRESLRLLPIHDPGQLRRSGKILFDNLPEPLAGNLHALLQQFEVLFDALELKTLADAVRRRTVLCKALPAGEALSLIVRSTSRSND